MERREDFYKKNPIIAKFVLTMYALGFGLSIPNLFLLSRESGCIKSPQKK